MKDTGGVDEKRRRAIERKLASAPPRRECREYLRACAGTLSERRAIQVQCLECMGWDRAEIPGCTSWGCPLWAYRPFRSDDWAPGPELKRWLQDGITGLAPKRSEAQIRGRAKGLEAMAKARAAHKGSHLGDLEKRGSKDDG